MSARDKRWIPNRPTRKKFMSTAVLCSLLACSWVSSAVAICSSVLKCYYGNYSDPEMLGFVN